MSVSSGASYCIQDTQGGYDFKKSGPAGQITRWHLLPTRTNA